MRYTFDTNTTMKPYNRRRFWIMSDYIKKITVTADTIDDAIARYAEIVNNTTGATISANAIKNKQPMYIDAPDGQPQQIGFVFTAATEIYDYDNPKISKQYIDLWTTITVCAFN